MSDFDARIRRIEDRQAISDLIQDYTFAMDNRDLEWAMNLFTEDGRFRSADGEIDGLGREAMVDLYRKRFAALGFNFHVTHDQHVVFESDDVATGLVSSHAEIVRNGETMVAAMRYHDVYRRCNDAKWRFADRCIHFFYYVPVAQYLEALKGSGRMRAYGDVRDADLPETAWRQTKAAQDSR
jgi:uncharacterized protein (TIGR02246 family)